MLAHQPRGGSHSSRLRIAPKLKQPTRAVDAKRTCPLARARRPYSALLRVGFAMRAALPKPRCALTAPFHPCLILSLANLGRPSAVCSLWHFPSAAIRGQRPGGRYPPPLFRGARTFLVPCGTRLPSPLAPVAIDQAPHIAKPTIEKARFPLTVTDCLIRNRFICSALTCVLLDTSRAPPSPVVKEMELGHATTPNAAAGRAR